jgi:hypothetical protein
MEFVRQSNILQVSQWLFKNQLLYSLAEKSKRSPKNVPLLVLLELGRPLDVSAMAMGFECRHVESDLAFPWASDVNCCFSNSR